MKNHPTLSNPAEIHGWVINVTACFFVDVESPEKQVFLYPWHEL
jgi:hypothetical protein